MARRNSGKAKGLLRSVWRWAARDRMSLAVAVTLIVLVVLLSYIGVYAKVTKNGYYRAHLVAQLREARVTNVELRADIQTLSSPERLGQVAAHSGMQVCSQFDYIDNSNRTIVVADAGGH